MESGRKCFQECQRVRVTRDTLGAEQVVRISLERYDETLGWYIAGSMCLPLCQLPVLQQAIDEMSSEQCRDCPEAARARKVIPFPLLAPSAPDAVRSGAS